MMRRVGLMTSGGDAPGMNAAVRAVVRTARARGAEVYGIHEGFRGLMKGDSAIRPLHSEDVRGILSQGGTVLGTARCAEMLEPSGRRKAVQALLSRGIDRLIVVGGDGSLTGADLLRREWADHARALAEAGQVPADSLDLHPTLAVLGLPGTIDNDMCGTDITIGADTALHRIVSAIDAIFSTAASHQRTFVVEVMGRHCGYLAVMAAVATGAEWLLVPEDPPEEGWEERMGQALSQGRRAGKRASIVIVAEGARDRKGNPLSSQYVQKVLEERMGEDARVTILGHVQRGGSPSAFDRNFSTFLGYRAAQEALRDDLPESLLVGLQGNRPRLAPLMECVSATREAQAACTAGGEGKALELRGSSLVQAYGMIEVLNRAHPQAPEAAGRRTLALVHSGAPAPGMNMAVRAAVRVALDRGHRVLGIQQGFQGLLAGEVKELDWMSVSGWAPRGGAELGTSHNTPQGRDLYTAARVLEDAGVEGLLMIGGWSGYEAVYRLYCERPDYPAFGIPMVCVPASIDNNLPGSELSVGADTALNAIMEAADRIKHSGVATRRCFLVEVMGDCCGYLARMGGLATGAERVYLHECPVRSQDLLDDAQALAASFDRGRRVALVLVNEKAHRLHTNGVLRALYEEEGRGHFDVRQSILGHLQQGGDPTPFDRLHAARLALAGVERLLGELDQGTDGCSFLGMEHGQLVAHDFHDYPRRIDAEARRPREQWWMGLEEMVREMVVL